MTEYKTVFQLAESKGYNPEFNVQLEPKEIKSQFADHYPEECRYIDLCLIQKWLRDERKIIVQIELTVKAKPLYRAFVYPIETFKSSAKCEWIDNYEQALIEGINEALKLI